MEEKLSKVVADSQIRKERFSFELRINDNIVCQRYFRINGFKKSSLASKELTDTLVYCAQLIKDDLKDKTAQFNWCTAPQIFEDETQMREFEKNPRWKLEVPSFIILEKSEQNYVWDGKKAEAYDKFINRCDYLGDTEVTPCTLKLVFLDGGVEICSTCWDGNVYPRFIRTNIDLSNSKNKYKNPDVFAPFEASVVDMLNDKRKDLIPIIVKEFCLCCSYEDEGDYHVDGYGYDFRVVDKWNSYISSLERKYRKKTEQYFAGLEH